MKGKPQTVIYKITRIVKALEELIQDSTTGLETNICCLSVVNETQFTEKFPPGNTLLVSVVYCYTVVPVCCGVILPGTGGCRRKLSL